METWGGWLIYGWPLRLTLEGCEEVHIWKKKCFRIQGGSKANMVDTVSVERFLKHEKGSPTTKREDRGENAASRKQVWG